MATIARRRVGRGGGGGDNTADDDDDDKDHNSNTTIKQCLGEKGANDDSGDWQLTVGNVDNDRRRQRQPLERGGHGGGLGQRFGRGGGEWRKQRRRTRAAEDSGGAGGLWDVKRA